ncbi:TIGR04283 family arsenosugar biosynthesis glycosyltransferase [Pleurocapsa sp. FMAR1]|uniref:TIGR04283 family arsenosugar biosynthesis glycosyltransferase n=1 Tax=Pleurocapsa sp. FMAR1 TaxID=3040204 RepID=UPI0029C98274|nr:TIGR04283 family arsenosugar biosynthesis glycosyltransferase [Pleurocapsa sp. FMAR1]
MAQYTISIIIPVLNEARVIKQTVGRLQKNYGVEIIVIDGGSQDNTVAIAQQTGSTVLTVAGKGRAAQMNAGAAIAQGDIVLFLHADTQLPLNFKYLAVHTLKQPGAIAGAFELAIAGTDKSLRWIEIMVKMRSRLLSLPYGDQAIFLKKQTFEEVGGFADLPIMEDFELVQRLKRQGKIAIAPAQVITSGRRWQKLGVWQTTLINQLVIAGYYLGISPDKLSNLYRSRNK